MKHRGATSSRWAQQICQFISQPAIWQARLLLLKGIIQAQGCRHQSLLPSFSPSPFPLHLLLPPPSIFRAFSIRPPPSLFQSVELCLLRLKRVLGLQQQTWKEQGRKKYPSFKFFPLSLLHKKKPAEVLKIWNDGLVKGDEQVITLDIKGVRWGECESQSRDRKEIRGKEKREEVVERRLGA